MQPELDFLISRYTLIGGSVPVASEEASFLLLLIVPPFHFSLIGDIESAHVRSFSLRAMNTGSMQNSRLLYAAK